MPIYEVDGPDGKTYEIEGDTPPTDEELDEIFKSLPNPNAPKKDPNFEANLAASEKHVKPEQGISDLLKGVATGGLNAVKGVSDIAREGLIAGIAPGMGLNRLMEHGPGIAEGMLENSARNMQGFENPILRSLASVPVIGDTLANVRRGVEEGDLHSAGQAIFDVGTVALPSGASAAKVPAKAVANSAGRAIRPSQLTRANHAVGGSALGEVGGTLAGIAMHSPYAGNRLGRILTKGSDLALAGRDKLANILDPSGSPQALQAQIEKALQEPPKVYEGPAIDLPVAEGTTTPVHKSILSQQDPNAFLKEQIEPPPIKTQEQLWDEADIEVEAGGRPLIPEPVEPLAPAFEANPAPYANTPTGPVRDTGSLEGAFARTAQEQAVATAQRQGRQAQKTIEKILSGRTSGKKIDELILPDEPPPLTLPENMIDPNTVIDDVPMKYESSPVEMPGYQPRTPGEQYKSDVAFREQLMRDEINKPESLGQPTSFPTEVRSNPVEKFAKLEGSDQATTASGKLVKRGQGKLKGLEADLAETSNLSNVSPYKLGDLAPNATRHKLKNPRMKGTNSRTQIAKDHAKSIRKDPSHYDSLSAREKAYFDRFYTKNGKRRKDPKPGKKNEFPESEE